MCIKATRMQTITSKRTSLNHIPRGFKVVFAKHTIGGCNLDYGGGKYNTATDWLYKRYFITNRVYDPFNRTEEHNNEVLGYTGRYTTMTCFNVLNVIKQELALADTLNHIKQLKDKHRCPCFITIYEGDKSGKGKKTTKGWQRNQRLKEYFWLFDAIFGEWTVENKVVTLK